MRNLLTFGINRHSARRIAVVACTALTLSPLALFNGSAGALAQGDVSVSQLKVAAMPSSTASYATWQHWAAQQQSVMQRTDWTAALSRSQCAVTDNTIVPVTSDGTSGIPAGIVLYTVNLIGNCASSPLAGQGGSTTLSPHTSSHCPLQTSQSYWTYVTGGQVCVGNTWINGSDNFVAASYYRTAVTPSYGHPELGTDTGSCDTGSLIVNGHPEMSVNQGSFSAVIWGPQWFSGTFTSTWWQNNGGGNYSNLGVVCGAL